MSDKKEMTYADAGVDVDAGNRAVEMIKEMVERTFPIKNGKVLSGLGGFCNHVQLPDGKIVSASTDGVGTKLLVAQLLGIHDTIGIDLVAMCVNDLIANGVSPLFFLDYMAFWKQIPALTVEIMEGIAEGCCQAGCALIGGEMAELPGMYEEGIYDLSACAVGVSDSVDKLILGDKVEEGMFIYGLPSSGLHSNAFSLVRKIFGVDPKKPKKSAKALNKFYPELGMTLGEELLKPTKIYVNQVLELMSKYDIRGLAHITGGGLVDNPPRAVPNNFGVFLDLSFWDRSPVFDFIQKAGNVSMDEMLRSTNCGLGFIVISPDKIETNENLIEVGFVAEDEHKTHFTF